VKRLEAFFGLFAFKVVSTAFQLFFLSLLASNGSSNEPFYQLKTIAYLGAVAAALRGVDALLDPVLRKVTPPILQPDPVPGKDIPIP
jgi:hypothetical protein